MSWDKGIMVIPLIHQTSEDRNTLCGFCQSRRSQAKIGTRSLCSSLFAYPCCTHQVATGGKPVYVQISKTLL